MNEERRKILELLSAGKISVDEAEKLLSAISSSESEQEESSSDTPGNKRRGLRYLRVVVEPDPEDRKGERINIRVPLKLIRAGLKWASFIPKDAKKKVNKALSEKGIEMDFDTMKPEDLEELMENLNDLTVDVEGKEKIRIFCE